MVDVAGSMTALSEMDYGFPADPDVSFGAHRLRTRDLINVAIRAVTAGL
jgi:hypothetical protein